MNNTKVKIDPTKLKKVSTYAREHKLSVAGVYYKESQGEIVIIKIDGVNFVDITKS